MLYASLSPYALLKRNYLLLVIPAASASAIVFAFAFQAHACASQEGSYSNAGIAIGSPANKTEVAMPNQNRTAISDNQTYTSLSDDFGGPVYLLKPLQSSPNGKWYGLWNGGGSFGTIHDNQAHSNVFFLAPHPSSSTSETHSALVVSSQEFKDFKLSVDIRVDKQIRQGAQVHSWEAGWIMWRWNDPTHHYYISLKTTGEEVGKYDGGTNPQSQIILKTVSEAPAEVGEWDHLDLTVSGNHIVAITDGIKTFNFNDTSSFDRGKIALYCEDSRVSFDNIKVTPLP